MRDMGTDRRLFLAGASAAFGALSFGASSGLLPRAAEAAQTTPLGPTHYRERAFLLRVKVAEQNLAATPRDLQRPTNGDEERLPNQIGTYTKGLAHQDNGEVVLDSYRSLIKALKSGSPADFENVQLGGARKQVGMQAGLGFELEGGDPRSFVIPAPPSFSSRETAAEIAENYWMALLRDVPFALYPNDPIASAAAQDLSRFGKDAKLPKDATGAVTPELLFRGLTAGDRVGPYCSQFLYLPFSVGPNQVDQQITTLASGVDFMTTFDEWLAIQRGGAPRAAVAGAHVYLTSGRDIGRWVHVDVLFQAYLHAALMLQGRGAPLNPGNPYRTSAKQAFVGFLPELAQVCALAVRAAFFQKWQLHRRLRPEVFAARVDRALYHDAKYPVHREILQSLSSSSRLGGYMPAGNALLPMAYPEGSPTHPAYPAAHAVIAGACSTLLKAVFDETWPIPGAKQPNLDGTALEDYTTTQLTLGGEVNKLASNVSLARDIAGVHWRSDSSDGLALGEAVTIQFLTELRQTLNEGMRFNFTKFDGTAVSI